MSTAQRVAAAAVVALLGAASASAQDVTSARPSGGLFGGSVPQSVTHGLDATVSLSAAYAEHNRSAETERSILLSEGMSSDLDASLAYTWRGDTLEAGATGGSNVRYFTSEQRLLRVNDHVSFGVGTTVGRRLRVFANQSVSCGPLQFLSLFPAAGGDPIPGATAAVSADFSLGDERACNYATAGAASLGIGQRSSLEFSSGWRYASYEEGSAQQSLNSISVGGRFLHNLTRNMRLRAGYTRRTGEFRLTPMGAAVTLHDLDIGIDYLRPLSLTRRTYLDFGTGSTVVSIPPSGEFAQRLEYRISGNAALNHEFGRTWRARVGYNRGVSFVEGLRAPASSDGMVASLSGFFSARVDVTASAGLAKGSIETVDQTSDFTSYSASARVRFALGRIWALYTEYTHYSHQLPADGVLFGVPDSLNRNVGHVGLTLWLPLLRR